MFSHLDDPHPPSPGPALAERLVAEGRRRRRRRVQVATGALAVLVLVGGTVVLRPWEDGADERGVVAEGGTTTTSAPDTTSSSVPSTSTTTTVPAGDLSRIVVPGDWPTGPVFAGITLAGDVVLSDPRTGAVLLTLLAAQPAAPAAVVSISDAQDAVYVGTYFDHRGGPLLRLRPGEPVAVLGTADVVAVSPDGARLATIAGEGYATDEVRILDAGTGELQSSSSVAALTGDGDLSVRAVVWDAPGQRLLVEAGGPEEGSELYVVDPGESARRIGPPDGRPDGTGWSLGGPVAGDAAVVVEICCSLDANSYVADSALLVIDLATGAEEERVPVEGPWGRLAVGPAGERLVLTGCCGSPDARLLGVDLQPLGGPVYAGIDW